MYEHRGLKAYWDKHVIIKVKLQLRSDSSVDKWFLTEAEFQEAACLLAGQEPKLRRSVPDRLCEVCLEGSIERRYPGCQVRETQHGFCSACIHRWMTEHDTCPFCRQELPGTAEQRKERLMMSVSVASDSNVRTALSIIFHLFR